MSDLNGAIWRKSTRSGGNGGDCVEVAANVPGIVAVRDSKDPSGPVVALTPGQWREFVEGIKTQTLG
jgi:hypothetical protein